MKFTMDVKELKKLMDKGITAIDKKMCGSGTHKIIFPGRRKWNC